MLSINQAIDALNNRRFEQAEALFRAIISKDARNFDALHMLAVVCSETGKTSEAETLFLKALSIDARFPPLFYNYGLFLAKLRRYQEAVDQFNKALTLSNGYAPAYCDRGVSLMLLGRLEESLASHNRAAALAPNVPMVFYNRANTLFRQKSLVPALRDYDRAIALHANYADAHCGRGNVFLELRRYDDALAAYDRALALNPGLESAWLGRGNVLLELKRHDDALASFDKALALNPGLENAWLGRGNVFGQLNRHDDAFAAYDKALSLKPDLAEALYGRGIACLKLKRYDEAFAAFNKSYAINPDLVSLESSRLHTKMHLCDWSNFDAECAHLISTVKSGIVDVEPFPLLAIPCSSGDQFHCAKLWTANRYPPSDKPIWRGERYDHDRIRVAYLSADFRDHPVSVLLAGLFEHHDRSQFRTIAFSFGPDNRGKMRDRVKDAFETFVDVEKRSDSEVADLLRELEVDIAVDLMGLTQGCRMGIFARRPAPVQVNYLGYPGTTGADYIDYIFADRFVIPEDQRDRYTEKIVYLPDTFQANDSRRPSIERTPSRGECGLPADAFVFCAFNANHKITPLMFDIWMRLLRDVEGSVLWLVSSNSGVEDRLRREAESRGIGADRLIFAPRINYADYLARYRCADLFLDTLPFNGGTTVSDALWAGLPVVACSGEAFAARMAASLLNSIGLPELAAESLQHYEDLARKLASDRSMLAVIKARLSTNRGTCPLFDTDRIRRHIESAYRTMYDRPRRGEPPEHFAVAAIAPE